MSYTKGPWILSEFEVRHPITRELRKGCEIFCADNNRLVCEIPDYHYHAEDVEYQSADARLIAAAPCLLETLERIIKLRDDGLSNDYYLFKDAVDVARTIVARAKGEQP